MDKTENYESKAKDRFNRQIATEFRGKVSNISLCFPSVKAKDTNLSFETGVYSKDTYLLPVEMMPQRRPIVEKQLLKLTENFSDVIGVKAHSIKLEKYLDKGEQIDYMPFDICGNYTMQLARWFFLYQDYFAQNMRFPITIQAGNKRAFSYVFNAVLLATKGKYFDFVDKLLAKTEFHFANGRPSQTAMESIYSQIYLIYCSMPNKILEFKSLNIYNNSEKVKRAEGQRGKLAENMVLLDIEVKDRKCRNKIAFGKLKKIVKCYNDTSTKEKIELKHRVRKNKAKEKIKKPMRIYNPPRFKNANEIAKALNIYGQWESMDEVPQPKQSWIKIHAKQNGLDPITCYNKIMQRLELKGISA